MLIVLALVCWCMVRLGAASRPSSRHSSGASIDERHGIVPTVVWNWQDRLQRRSNTRCEVRPTSPGTARRPPTFIHCEDGRSVTTATEMRIGKQSKRTTTSKYVLPSLLLDNPQVQMEKALGPHTDAVLFVNVRFAMEWIVSCLDCPSLYQRADRTFQYTDTCTSGDVTYRSHVWH